MGKWVRDEDVGGLEMRMWDGLENQNPEVRPNPWAHCGLDTR